MAFHRICGAAILVVIATSGASAFLACGTSTFQGAESDDAGTDASASTDAPFVGDAGRFCPTQAPDAYLCADFEDDDIRNAFVAGTDRIFFAPPDAGSITLATDGENGSSGLAAVLPALATGVTGSAFIAGAAPDPLGESHVTLRVDIRFDAVGDVTGAGKLYLVTLELDGDTAKSEYDLTMYSGDMHLDIASGGVSKPSIDLGPPPAPGPDWVPFTIDLRLAAVVSVSDTGQVTATLGPSSGSSQGYIVFSHQNITVTFGPRSQGDTGNIDLRFDDARFDISNPDAGLPFIDGG